MELTLAIETSCDDTCAAVLEGERVLSNVIASQGVHDAYGGVVPELAARQHVEAIGPVVAQALRDAGTGADDISRVAVTRGPGLVGSLLIGLQSAKAFALPRGLPLVAVDHMHGHLAATRLAERPPEGAHLALIASGGHTLLLRVDGPRIADATVLGRTLDDAAGEAIDKGARMLGLGYPGGPVLERAAVGGDPTAYPLPIGEKMRGLDFSFAGMKTALLYLLRDLPAGEQEAHLPDLAASLQHAVAEALALRVKRAVASTGLNQLALGGGVAANSLLRSRLTELGVELAVPAREYCTDNAAMIGVAACWSDPTAFPNYLGLDAFGNGSGALR